MALNIKNKTVEELVSEVAGMTGETKTEVIRRAVDERRKRLLLRLGKENRAESLLQFLERDVWPLVPEALLGARIDKAEREAILGYGAEGV